MAIFNEGKEIKESQNEEKYVINETSKLALEQLFLDDYDENEYTDEQLEKMRDEYEFFDEWKNRDEELHEMPLEEYNEMRCIETYSDSPFEKMDDMQTLEYLYNKYESVE